jgi:hypothetical protein
VFAVAGDAAGGDASPPRFLLSDEFVPHFIDDDEFAKGGVSSLLSSEGVRCAGGGGRGSLSSP